MELPVSAYELFGVAKDCGFMATLGSCLRVLKKHTEITDETQVMLKAPILRRWSSTEGVA